MTATAIAELLADLTLPAALEEALAAALPQLGDETTWLAVRSSATGEDGATTSYAGAYVTTLGARGLTAIRQAILTSGRTMNPALFSVGNPDWQT